MTKIKFTVVLPPAGQRRPRGRAFIQGGKAIAGAPHKDPKQRQEENKLLALLYQHRPPTPLQGPLALGVRAYLSIPASKSRKWQNDALAGDIRPTTKPDLDNILKHLKDCCNKVFWEDDKQIVEYLPGTGKYYGSPARWEIEIISLEDQRRELVCG